MTIANVFFSKDYTVSLWSEIDTLFEYLILPLAKKKGKDFADEAEANLMCEYISLTNLDKDEFKLAYDLTMTACDKEKILTPYKDKFEQAFKQDPRYTAIA